MSELQLGLWSGARVRLVRQTERAECGLACLAMIASYHGLDISLGHLRRRYQPSLRGAPLKSLIGISDALGLTSRAVKLRLDDLAHLHLPAILHWNMNHYVVVERIKGNKVLVHDPEGYSKWHSFGQLSNHFTGVALELRPADDFERGQKQDRLRLSQLWRRITGLKRALAQTLVLSVVMQAFVLVSPYYMQVAIDSALPAFDQSLLTVLALGFGLLLLINVGASLLRSFVLLSAGTAVSFGVAGNVARRLFRLPVSWFEKRHIGDILSRFQSIQPIQQALTQGAIAALLDGILALLTLALMFFYSAKLAAISLVAFGLYALLRAVSFSMQRDAQEAAIVAASKEQSTLIESLRGITTLRLFNREAVRHAVWQTRLTEAVNASVGVSRITLWQQSGNALIIGAETIIIVWLGVGLVMSGGFSVGMLFAYISYKTQFLSRSASLIDQSIAFRMLGLHLDRLSDIALAEQDVSFREPGTQPTDFLGRIELRDVSFRYSPTDPLVLRGINLIVEPGEHVAITGPSGGGKSTLIKIILGLVQPDSGEVLVDGVLLEKFGYKYFLDHVAAVLQEDHLFAGSLADNIALFEDAPRHDQVVAAAKAAAIYDDIARMPMKFETLVGDMGSTLSGGQKQRLLLARALYRRPRLLVVDEGTSHLDVERERAINESIAELGATRIVVAHRTETIKAAGRVYYLADGCLDPASAGNVVEAVAS